MALSGGDRDGDKDGDDGDDSHSGDGTDAARRTHTRRDVLAGGAAAGAASLAGCGGILGGEDAPESESVDGERARTLAEAHAPDLYFGVGERWFPTDPREYLDDDGDGSVLDGFAAFDGYARDYDPGGEPPNRTAFYNVARYPGTDLAVVQYWFYSAFDQFSVNFHWHDWEVLHAFLDVGEESGDPETGDPTLLVASAHSRKVPNNEFLDPDTQRASVISEVGSHSSALGVNETPAVFERLPISTDTADISNGPLAPSDIPAAYGLPRSEGYRLPFVVPELDGSPVVEHPDLPNVTPDHLVPAEFTVESFSGIPSPPEDLPLRETGVMFAFEGADSVAEADYDYALAPMADLDIEEYAGPQLSFEFAVPSFAEDAVAGHLTTVGTPQDQPRFENPTDDVTDPRHRSALSERFDVDVSGLAGDVVGLLREATASDDAPGSNGVDTDDPTVEGIALLESDPEAVPTFNGVVALRDVPDGEHRLTVNGAGVAPYGQRIVHGDADSDEGTTGSTTTESTTTESTESTETSSTDSDTALPPATTVGVDGDVVVTPNEDAVKVRAEPAADAGGFDRVAVEDDFAGSVFDGRPADEDADSAAVYVHSEGAYTAEVEDESGGIGAFRVNPRADQSTATIREARTGKPSLASFLLTILTETTAQATVFADGDADGIDEVDVPDSTAEQAGEAAEAVDDVLAAAAEAAEAAEDGDDDDDDSGNGGGNGGNGGGGGGPSGFTGLLRALEATTTAAKRANEAAQAGNAEGADNRLRGLRQRTEALAGALERNRENLPGSLPDLVERRVPQVVRRIDQALDADE
ncbi:hypothetical protein Hbl1158_07000 [Halobaculum sp. CBA1158]|uniref:hypothetical protein n=1 Tax=Halobaculum sp. CBA1158 TaxID=2904243 RepID=UPI001F3CFDB0|nr:hypothetical protein [Halobaculum sp. CBA1158]UIP01090.1 hypothetical protein Hbl1158_07000 [Halobaculum sp. CBA1158]